MASPNTNEIVSSTLRHRRKKLMNNVSNNNAFLFSMRKNGNIELIPGGQHIMVPLEYAENQTYTRYSGAEEIDISPSNVITSAEYLWKQIALSVFISGLEELQNDGPERMLPLLKSRIKNAEHTFENNFSTDLYSAGTADSGKQIGGLQMLISTTPTTGTVASISRDTWAFWRNVAWNANTDGSVTLSASNIKSQYNKVMNQLIRGTDKCDLILADNNHYDFILEDAQGLQRIQESKLAALGFDAVRYRGADIVLDGGYGGAAPSDRSFFLNTRYLSIMTHRRRNMVPLSPDRHAVNQDATVRLTAWAGNLVCSNMFLQGTMVTS